MEKRPKLGSLMPVTLDMKAPAAPKSTPSPTQEAIQACIVPDEIKMSRIALGAWLGILVFLCALPWIISAEALQPVGIGLPIWCLLSIAVYLQFGPKYLTGKLRGLGARAAITQSNKPTLKKMISTASPVLSVREPRAFLADAKAPRARVWPESLLFNAPLFGIMDENEVSVLGIRGLAHQKMGHGRRLALLDLLDQTPPITRALVWPVLLYARLLRQFWLPHAHKSADRLALLLVRNPSPLLSAVVKEYAANDAQMQDMSITSEDVGNWISQKGHIGMKGEEISTQYKLGRAIHETPLLEDRVQEIQRWAATAQFKEATEKLANGKK